MQYERHIICDVCVQYELNWTLYEKVIRTAKLQKRHLFIILPLMFFSEIMYRNCSSTGQTMIPYCSRGTSLGRKESTPSIIDAEVSSIAIVFLLSMLRLRKYGHTPSTQQLLDAYRKSSGVFYCWFLLHQFLVLLAAALQCTRALNQLEHWFANPRH